MLRTAGVAEAALVVADLQRRGELYAALPGVVGLRGDALALFRGLEARIASLARAVTSEEWMVPAAISLRTLARADYFASFPQWLTTASHLSGAGSSLEAIATAHDPAAAAAAASGRAQAALPPAVCYHVYEALAGRTLARPSTITAQCTCWRHEGAGTAALERGWAFTMREAVLVGSDAEVIAFRADGIARAVALAAEFGFDAEVVEASDPFFMPTSRGRALLQQVKSLKHELVVGIGGDRPLAIASFNHHESFFGRAFDIRLGDGTPASSGCVAFGLERWLLAWLCVHGPDARAWPSLGQVIP